MKHQTTLSWALATSLLLGGAGGAGNAVVMASDDAGSKERTAATAKASDETGARGGLALYQFSEAEKTYKFAHLTFYETFEKWAHEDVGRVMGEDEVLAIGSSSFTGWKSMQEDLGIPIVRRGFGGSRMIDVLAYKDFFRRYKAKRILICEGGNDLGGSFKLAPETFVAHCKEFVEYIHEVSPDTEFYFLAIKITSAREKKWPEMRKASSLLKEYLDTDPRLHYVDTVTPMFNAEGTATLPGMIGKDGVHMTAEGYKVWIKEIKKHLDR